MADKRLRANFVSGNLQAQISATEQHLSSPGFAKLPDIGLSGGNTDYALVVLDPFGAKGDPEVVRVQRITYTGNPTPGHVAGSTDIYVVRGYANTVARIHLASTPWVHAPVNSDFDDIEALIAQIQATPGTLLATASAITLTPDQSNTVGTSTSVARADHRHNVPADVAGASAPGDAAAEGTATAFARADHVHARESIRNLRDTVFPVGTVFPYAGSSAPSGFVLCDGALYDRTAYAALFAVVGTTYGNTTGSNFRVPDLRGRMPLGKDDMGVGSANRVTAGSADILGGSGGEENHQLVTGELPAHTHNGPSHTHNGPSHTHTGGSHTHAAGGLGTSSYSHTHTIGQFGYFLEVVYGGTYGLPPGYGLNTVDRTTSADTHSHTVTGTTASGGAVATDAAGTGATSAAGTGATSSTGSDTPHNNMPPYLTLNYIISTGVNA